MKTLLQINVVANWGSTGRIAEEIGMMAINQGWKSYIAYGRNSGVSESNLIRIGDKWDIRKHVLKSRLFDKHGFGSKKATINLIEDIKKINPDIIHLHNIHGYYINIEVLFDYLATLSIPIVWTLHDCWSFTGHCAHFLYSGCNKWKTECYECPLKRSYPKSIIIDRSKENYKIKYQLFRSVNNLIIVPVSNWLKRLTNDSFINIYPAQCIYNGVNLETFIPLNKTNIQNKFNINNRFTLLGVSSVWTKRKGLDDFINLSKLIQQDSVIILVGLNQKQIKELPSNIIGIQRTENIQQLVEIYSAADLFLNLTYEDTFPTTNIESLACGTPVLTYNTGGSPEAVDIETGFVVEKGELNTVIDIINLVKEKGKAYYSSACRKRAVSLYNKDDRYNEYIQLYNRILIRK